ncbi:MAG: DUF4442 domain-containing protein [Candidatus Thiodiazotropha sp.]
MIDVSTGDSAARRLERFPPFLKLGVRVVELHTDWRQVRILLPLSAENRNPGGSMFGGCIASLADPIPALACHRQFPEHAVWTRHLQIDFRRPGLTDLELRFELTEASISAIGQDLAERDRSTPCFEFGFYDAQENLVAWVKNRVAIRPAERDVAPLGAMSGRPQVDKE